MTETELKRILKEHALWLAGKPKRACANLRHADLREANLEGACLEGADLEGADLEGADLRRANLRRADLRDADLEGANLRDADLEGANLRDACLEGADLRDACLEGANLRRANLRAACLEGADLRDACLEGACLEGTTGLIKRIGVAPGDYYWKMFGTGLVNNGFTFKVGLNTLPEEEVFAADPRVLCSYPGFHFASESWCATYYGSLPYKALIRLPEDAKINEPWATDGKASADRIIIIKVIGTATGRDVTDQFRG